MLKAKLAPASEEIWDYSMLYKMLGSLFTEIMVLSAKWNLNVTTSVSHASTKNCPFSLTMLSTATTFEAASDYMKLNPSLRDSAKVTNLSHSMGSSRITCLSANRAQITTSPGILTDTSSIKIKSLKCLGQGNHIRSEPKLVFYSKRSALVDDRCEELGAIVLAKPVSCSIRTASKVLAQNSGEDPSVSSQTKVSRFHIGLSLAGPIQGISCPGGLSFKVFKANHNCQDERFVDNVKRHFPMSQEEETEEEILNSASCWCPNLGVISQKSRSRYTALTAKPKTDPKDIYQDACYFSLPRDPETESKGNV
ncbi:hypothetical protein ACTXT7_003839 [Hymenolepis weldensis]